MKVYIGRYNFRWVSSVHEKYMNWKYGRNAWEDSHNKFESALQAFEDFLQACYNLTINRYLDAHYRTIRVRIDPSDTWSMDHTLAHIIVPMLEQLASSKHGVAIVDMADVPDVLRIEDDGESIEWMERRWNYVINEMIWAFSQKCRDDWMSDYYEFADDHSLNQKPLRWDDQGIKAHQTRMTKGFKLFGKYYEALWD
jgi:hypothetical protein